VRPRQMSMWLAKHLTGHSLSELGRKHGDRDHTTVLHAIRKINALIAEDAETKADAEYLLRSLGWDGPLPTEGAG